MSRLAKASRNNILTRQPPKPCDCAHCVEGSVWALTETLQACSAKKSYVFERKRIREEALGELGYSPSKIQKGVARLVQELYNELKVQDEVESPPRNQLEYTSASQGPRPSVNQLFLPLKQNLFEVKYSTQLPLGISSEEDFQSLVSKDPDTISLEDYLHRIFEWGQFEDDVALLAYVLIQRALLKHRRLRAKHFHKLTGGCILLAHSTSTRRVTGASLSSGISQESSLKS